MSFLNLEEAVVGTRDRVLALLEPLNGEGIDVVKNTSRGKYDGKAGLLFEYMGFAIIEESPHEDEYELMFRLQIHLREEDPDKSLKASLNLISRSMRYLYEDRTLGNTVVDVKIPSSTDDARGEMVPEDGQDYASKISSLEVNIRVLIATPT